MSMHVLINLSWKCQLKCPYCLIPHIKANKRAKEHSWQDWAAGIIRHVTPGSIVDVAGGEPLLFPGLAHFLAAIAGAGINWAITTNALSSEGIDELLAVRPGRNVMVNVSDHPGNQGADANIERLRTAYHVAINRVAHSQAGKRPGIRTIIPYQRYREGQEQDGQRRLCDSGIRHWVADPAMNVFLCNVAMATGRAPIGNLLGEIETPAGPFECDWGCSTCYTSCPGAWQCNQRVIA